MATSVLKPPSCFQKLCVQSGSNSVTVSGNNVATTTLTVSLPGWKPLGVVSMSQNKPGLSWYGIGWADNGSGAKAWFSFRNTSSSSITATVTATLLFRKE